MKINFIEIQNFRKLRSVRIDLDPKTTVFVGANNSGKTSAMLALRYFLVSPEKISLQDIILSNWEKIDGIGKSWEESKESSSQLDSLLPSLDIWFSFPVDQIEFIRYVKDFVPTLEWRDGLLGVRLQCQLKKGDVRTDYVSKRKQAIELSGKNSNGNEIYHWPRSLTDFLDRDRQLQKYLEVLAYPLDPEKYQKPKHGVARPQLLSDQMAPVERKSLESIIRVDEIKAHRDVVDHGNDKIGSRSMRKVLSKQLGSYYDRHLNPEKNTTEEEVKVIATVQLLEKRKSEQLNKSFAIPFGKIQNLGYPAVADPTLKIDVQLSTVDILERNAILKYMVDNESNLSLSEEHNGLGYQNLISMAFMLMGYRDAWMRVGKMEETDQKESDIEPIHLVLIEEPEVHLHAQAQQIFIDKTHELLRDHKALGKEEDFSTQLIITTHSSHIAYKAEFSGLRYFRKHLMAKQTKIPETTVVNLSDLFGDENDKTQEQEFVKRYLRIAHYDLLFADAAIFVEGAAEHILIPQFIQQYSGKLSSRYITLLEVGGAHAHKFKGLIDAIGLTTLIVTDLDSASLDKKSNRWKAVPPKRNQRQETSNSVLRKWHPKKETIDDLLDLESKEHSLNNDIYVAFQKEVTLQQSDGVSVKLIPRTFEDAFVLTPENIKIFIEHKDILSENIKNHKGDLKKFAQKLFEYLRYGQLKKTDFALKCLTLNGNISPPLYVAEGLSWLERTLGDNAKS